MVKKHPFYGLLAEFESPEDLVAATQRAYEVGYRQLDGFTPFPVEGLAEAIGFRFTWLPLLVLIGGLIGCFGGFFLQVYPNSFGYPLNVGGRPYYSWPSFIPITFELTILCAALVAAVGMLALNGLPTPYHPVFNAPGFELATRNRFFLCIRARDPLFDRNATRQFLTEMKARLVSDVEG